MKKQILNTHADSVGGGKCLEDITASPQAYLRGLEAFYVLRAEARKNELTGMTLDEINEEIRLVREERSKNDAARQ